MKTYFKAIVFVTSLALMQSAYAFSWQDLWARPDEQAAALLARGSAKQAAQKFENKNWQGVANYRAGNYEAALENFSTMDSHFRGNDRIRANDGIHGNDRLSADSFYNQGNTLAHMNEYEAAIKAYDKALEINPNDADAKFNRELLKKLLKKNPQSKKNNQQQQKQQSSNPNKQKDKSQQQSKSDKNKQQQQQQKDKQQAQSQKHSKQPQQADQSDNKLDQKQQANNKQEKEKNSNPQQQSNNKNQKQDQPPQQRPLTRQQRETEQATKQWLRRIPDEPGGLLRQKFLRDHLRMQSERQR